MISRQNVIKFCWKDKKILELQRYENGAVETKQSVNASPLLWEFLFIQMTHIGQTGFKGPVTGKKFVVQKFQNRQITWGRQLKKSFIFVQVTHIGQRGFKRPVTGEKLFVPKFGWTWNYLGERLKKSILHLRPGYSHRAKGVQEKLFDKICWWSWNYLGERVN